MDASSSMRKKRLQNSCDFCRKKKVRCDSATMPNKICSVCRNAGIACLHSNAPKKRGPKANHTAQSALVYAILVDPQAYQIPEDSTSVRELLVDICQYARALEKDIARLRRAVSSDPSGSSPPDSEGIQLSNANSLPESNFDEYDDDSDDIDTNTISESFKHLSLYHALPRHYGMSSNFVLAQTIFEVDFEHNIDIHLVLKRFERPLFWTINHWQSDTPFPIPDKPLVFPEDQLLQDLVSVYFSELDPYFPLLHRTTFEQNIRVGIHFHDRSFGKVVLAVCALASRCLNDPRNSIPGVPCPEFSVGWPWFKQIAVMQTTSFIDPPKVYNLQLFVLSVLFLQGTTTSESSWITIGTAIRLAQAVGVHRKGPGPRTIERELWNRAFWALVNIDVSLSMFLGRPRATTVDDFDLELPVDCDQDYWENDDPEKMFVQPPGKPSLVSFWIHYTKLQQIAAAVHRLIYPIKKLDVWRRMGITGRAWHQKAVTELDSLLNQWVDHIPEHLKWGTNRGDSVFSRQCVFLYTTYYGVQIELHKAFIPRPGQESVLTFPSLSICANAARACIHAAASQTHIPVLPIYVLIPVFNSGIVLLMNIWRAKRSPGSGVDVDREMQAMRKCFDKLTDFSRGFQSAGRFIDTLNAIISVGNLQPKSPIESSSNTGVGPEHHNPPAASPLSDHSQTRHEGDPISTSASSVTTDPTLPFHSSELGEMPIYFSNALYHDLPSAAPPNVTPSTASMNNVVEWDTSHVQEMDVFNIPAAAGPPVSHGFPSPDGQEPYDPNVVVYYTPYGMQRVLASVQSYSDTSSYTHAQAEHIPDMGHHIDGSANSHWNNTSRSHWGHPNTDLEGQTFPDSGLGQDWSVFLSNVDELLHSASGDFYAQNNDS
ncbi:fungal-specific transcription factor domain-containing protein [Rhodocollybia butyracea]|uniref:Fungal-specific transcription factor domain-containing protein n=1 Tax=Rhodocollybia butyracea TaxID=206335 RepID=A0A9P5PXI2_9AGAR|nr:fungal-specific transcription factor domain-containing protein [Rhodocollybia butyracea]